MKKSEKIVLISILLLLIIVFVLYIFKDKNPVDEYEITFDSNGGTVVEKQIVKEGNKVIRPVEPYREGYSFVEWQSNGVTYNFDTYVHTNIELKAIWEVTITEKNDFIVKFQSNGGSLVSEQIVKKGEKAKVPQEPVKEGYTFKYWTLNDNEFSFDTEITKDIELVAFWTKNSETKYTVTFNTDGGSSIKSIEIASGAKVIKPANPTKTGYTFVEWQLNGKSYNFNTQVTDNITLKAVWKEIVKDKVYSILIEKVDAYSPDRYLTVYEDNTAITVKKLMYSDGVEVISSINGTKITVSNADIEGETEFKVLLSNNTTVTAKVK